MGFAPQCEAKHRRGDVLAIDNHTEPCAGGLESCGDGPGLAGRKGPHGIEKMREAREAL